MQFLTDIHGVIGLVLPLTLGLSPQIVPPTAQAILAGGALQNGRVETASLGLGTGGIRAVGENPLRTTRGTADTPGGVWIQAKTAGVKFEFPSGRELLITPDCRLHLRGGERSLPFLRGVRLILGDGTIVTVRRSSTPRRPLAAVEVESGGRTILIWMGNRSAGHATRAVPFTGSSLLVLGDGGTLYRASAAGPVVALERVLCEKRLQRRFPRRRLVILGHILAESMKLLPGHAPKRSVQFPQVAEAAERFAALGPVLFRRTVPRPPGAVGELWFELANQYRVKVESNDKGILTIGLFREGSTIPGVEWIVAGRTTIHFVRPTGGTRGGPRYFLHGLDLRRLVTGLLPIPSNARQRQDVAKTIAALGGRTAKKLEVTRR